MNQEQQTKVDVNAIMSDIRRKIQMEEAEANLPSFEDIPVQDVGGQAVADKDVFDYSFFMDSLDYVNRNSDVPYYHPLGRQGALKVFIKRAIRKLIRCVVFPILTCQNSWNAHAASCLNQLRYSVEKQQREIDFLREQLKKYKAKLTNSEDLSAMPDDDFYHDFEERFRGSEDDIRSCLSSYLPILKQYIADWENGKFVDVGCGRGEWLDLLRDNDASDYVGVDLNAVQCMICVKKGHKTVQMDCIRYLASLPDGTIDLVSGFQIVEHLRLSDLTELFSQSLRVLKPGGVVLFETPNPRNLIVGADTFYLDPTHKRPLDPALLSFLAERCGYEQIQCIEPSPHPEYNIMPEDPAATDRENMLAANMNNITARLYGPRDYALLAVKPKIKTSAKCEKKDRSGEKCMRVIQLLPTLSYGDAVGNDTLAIKKLLQELGYETQIYAENIDSRLPHGSAVSVERIPALSADDVIIYHGSIGSELNRMLLTMKGRKILIYHNITPPHFFKEYSALYENICKEGLKEMRGLADAFDYVIADSEFNKQDLLQMGYSCPIDVYPILIPFEDYKKPPSQKVIGQYRGDGVTNLLFVGRVTPNKKHENVIRAFYYYHKYYNPSSRLFLVGSWNGMELYYHRLLDYAKALGVAEQVIFTGHIPFDEILAYYHLADVFVCMSEHEGFCVPLVEAMYFRVPIVAYGCAAVPNTLGGSGIVLNSPDGPEAAEQIHRIASDSTLRQEIISGQDARLEDFSYERVSETISHLIQNFVNKGTGTA